ncbi:hypothetical protein DU500_08305 [Haloplanus rubicundus]|uniref:DUF7344 domain-containing protein n=1 Tax=Haloplanus rubicundus TaxID=1547898 RepID=A0A345E2J9_9EURY|nr:hypothetical protein [Haloplanus rubicundus]AXG06421.1 hypothetical protein DU500_08305 [Haloplanus rubicundus]
MSTPTHKPIDWTPLYESLASETRRTVLQFLTQRTGCVDVADVTDYLLRTADQSRTDERAAQVELQLYHVHLPRLADAGLVEWDTEQRTVSLTDLGLQLPVALLRPQLLGAPARSAVESAGD